MSQISISIDGKAYQVEENQSLRRAILKCGVYLPGLCDHPDLDAFKPFSWSEKVWRGELQIADCKLQIDAGVGVPDQSAIYNLQSAIESPHCNLCLVSINGGAPQRSCDCHVAEGASVVTASPDVLSARREALKKILARHPHACLTCAQRHGCDRIQCSMNVPVSERCCELLGRCEIGRVAEWIGVPNDTPAYHNEGRPSVKDEPLFLRDYELCIGCARCVKVCRDVRGVDVLGAVLHDGAVVVGTTGGSSLEESLCRFCGACVEVCPTGTLRDQPGAHALVGSLAPCSARCPLEIDVPGYMELIAEGEDFEALELIRERAVLPGVLGYACFHPCEENCRRGSLGGAALICALKRYVSDVAGDQLPRIVKKDPTGKRVAVIGGGPAGLAVAADLLRFGHEVTIFERAGTLGGMLRQTLPDFRLPDGVIDRDLAYLTELGLQTRLGVQLGRDIDVEALLNDDYKAVVLAIGLGEPLRLGVEGEELVQVLPGLELLSAVAAGFTVTLSGRVVIIGGGAVAVDAAMTARRLGASEVMMVSLESESEMPAHPEELHFASEEEIRFLHGWGVERFTNNSDGALSISLKKCTRVFDERGKFNPAYDVNETRQIDAEWAVVAIGQKRNGQLAGAPAPNVFFAGDAARGASSIVEAMADGRKVAAQVDKFLGGSGELLHASSSKSRSWIGRDVEFHHRKRVEPNLTPTEVRVQSHSPFIATITPEQARHEASRCLRCHLRASISKPELPPDPWRRFSYKLRDDVPTLEGVLILADEAKKTLRISGTPNLRAAVEGLLDEGVTAEYCRWECDPMFTKRESELIQAHLQAFGEMPGAGDLDDLF